MAGCWAIQLPLLPFGLRPCGAEPVLGVPRHVRPSGAPGTGTWPSGASGTLVPCDFALRRARCRGRPGAAMFSERRARDCMAAAARDVAARWAVIEAGGPGRGIGSAALLRSASRPGRGGPGRRPDWSPGGRHQILRPLPPLLGALLRGWQRLAGATPCRGQGRRRSIPHAALPARPWPAGSPACPGRGLLGRPAGKDRPVRGVRGLFPAAPPVAWSGLRRTAPSCPFRALAGSVWHSGLASCPRCVQPRATASGGTRGGCVAGRL